MAIKYKDTKEFDKHQLQRLFLSVEWSSGQYPDKLIEAMKHFGSVFSAWDNDKLIGLIAAIDDRVMTAYIHYVLVDPAYQQTGVGKELVNLAKDYYKDYLRILLVAYDNGTGFYERLGFHAGHDKVPMFITSLWT